jgi:hypothetical protein
MHSDSLGPSCPVFKPPPLLPRSLLPPSLFPSLRFICSLSSSWGPWTSAADCRKGVTSHPLDTLDQSDSGSAWNMERDQDKLPSHQEAESGLRMRMRPIAGTVTPTFTFRSNANSKDGGEKKPYDYDAIIDQ